MIKFTNCTIGHGIAGEPNVDKEDILFSIPKKLFESYHEEQKWDMTHPEEKQIEALMKSRGIGVDNFNSLMDLNYNVNRHEPFNELTNEFFRVVIRGI